MKYVKKVNIENLKTAFYRGDFDLTPRDNRYNENSDNFDIIISPTITKRSEEVKGFRHVIYM